MRKAATLGKNGVQLINISQSFNCYKINWSNMTFLYVLLKPKIGK